MKMNRTQRKEQLERNRKHAQLPTPESEGPGDTPDEDHLTWRRRFLRAFSSWTSERVVATKRMENEKERETLSIRLSGEGAETVAAALPEK